MKSNARLDYAPEPPEPITPVMLRIAQRYRERRATLLDGPDLLVEMRDFGDAENAAVFAWPYELATLELAARLERRLSSPYARA